MVLLFSVHNNPQKPRHPWSHVRSCGWLQQGLNYFLHLTICLWMHSLDIHLVFGWQDSNSEPLNCWFSAITTRPQFFLMDGHLSRFQSLDIHLSYGWRDSNPEYLDCWSSAITTRSRRYFFSVYNNPQKSRHTQSNARSREWLKQTNGHLSLNAQSWHPSSIRGMGFKLGISQLLVYCNNQ